MDKDMTTYAMLSTACDGFDELSAYTPEKIEISALSVRWALQEHCTVATSEYKESLTAAYAIALMYRAGMVGATCLALCLLAASRKPISPRTTSRSSRQSFGEPCCGTTKT